MRCCWAKSLTFSTPYLSRTAKMPCLALKPCCPKSPGYWYTKIIDFLYILVPVLLNGVFSQDSRMPVPERQWGICFYDDAIEFGGVVRKIKIKIPFITFFCWIVVSKGSVKYLPTFLQPMIQALSDSAPELRQAAAYGFGVMGMLGGNLYAQACAREFSVSTWFSLSFYEFGYKIIWDVLIVHLIENW